MSRRFDCDDPDERRRGLEQAAQAARRGALVVLPTDTVYGLGTDAFARGRGGARCWPPRVAAGTCRCRSWSAPRAPSPG